jgi:hypothetical protein
MGFTRFFRTDEENPQPMTLEEVKAGVQAIKAVAERLKNIFDVTTITDTSILVVPRRDNIEWLVFEPREDEKGLFVLSPDSTKTFCKTYERDPEDAGVEEMLYALQQAVNSKLYMSPEPQKPRIITS